jgi:hypothetical protein
LTELWERSSDMHSHRPGVTNFVHVGLVVEDLDEIVRFLALLGFNCGEPGGFSGEWIDRIIGLENVTVEVVMARAPDGSDMFEVVRFLGSGTSPLPSTTCVASSIASERPAGTRSGRSSTTKTGSSSATSADPKA